MHRRILMYLYFVFSFILLACGVAYYIMIFEYDISQVRLWDSSIILTYIMKVGRIYSPIVMLGIGIALFVLGWMEGDKIKARASADKEPNA